MCLVLVHRRRRTLYHRNRSSCSYEAHELMDIMDTTSSPTDSTGIATEEQQHEMANSLATQYNPESPADISFYSVTARWCKRATQFQAFEGEIQQWLCQQVSPAIQDLTVPHHSTAACCTLCASVARLKAHCESFVTCQKKYANAEKGLVEAEKGLVEAKEARVEAEKQLAEAETEYAQANHRWMANGQSSENVEMLELLTMRVADKAGRVADKANAIAEKDKLIAEKIGRIAAITGRIAAETRHIASEGVSIAREAGSIAKDVVKISILHSEVHSLLTSLRIAGNETSLVMSGSGKPRPSLKLDETRFDAEPQACPSKFEHLCELSVLQLDKTNLLRMLTDEQVKLLTPFCNHLQCVFEKAILLDPKDAKYRQKIELTVKAILGWNVHQSMNLSTCTTKFYIPGNVGQERNGVQPILHAILVKMAQVLGLRSNGTQEQGMPKFRNRSCRFVDSVVTNPEEEYLPAILPAMLGLPIEVKPITRKSTTVAKLLAEAENQVVGHLAKRAMSSFDFGGIGEDCAVFGLSLNMGSVTVIVLELSGVGTADVKVTAQRTNRMPLFDKGTRKNVCGENVKDVEDSFGEKIEQVRQGMPAGFYLLAQTLMSVHDRVGTSALTKTSEGECHSFGMHLDATESIELGALLGSGAFSHVFRLKEKETNDVFVKVPKSPQMEKSLLNEVQALTELAGLKNDIPQLFDTEQPLKTMHMRKRCETSTIPCLPLRGFIGQPASHQQSWTIEGLQSLVSTVYGVLQFANLKRWTHLDVRPSNIITRGSTVMLIDWGSARRTTDELSGFVGCPPYAHDQLFDQPQKLRPCLDYDLASLAYTVTCLFHGRIIWSGGFPNHHPVSDDFKQMRLVITRNVLNLLFRGKDRKSRKIKQALVTAIGKSRKRKYSGN